MIGELRALHREIGDVLARLERLAPVLATWQAERRDAIGLGLGIGIGVGIGPASPAPEPPAETPPEAPGGPVERSRPVIM